MHTRMTKHVGRTLSLVAVLLLAASPTLAQRVSGQWDFSDPGNRLKATVGQDGSYWTLPQTDQSSEVLFGSPNSFGIAALPGGDGTEGVMKFPAFDSFNGIEVWPGLAATPGWFYVNDYTLIMDVFYTPQSANDWRSLWQTNACNTNDGDFFINPQDGIGISGQYDGNVTANAWHRLAFAVGLDGPDPNDPNTVVDKYIDGVLVGSQILSLSADSRWSLYTLSDALPSMVFADESGDTAIGYVSSLQLRDHRMTPAQVAALGGPSATGIPGGTGVAGQWDFENPAAGLDATFGNDLTFFNAFLDRGCAEPNCPQDLPAATQFGTTTAFAIPDLPDGPGDVMRYPATVPCTAYLFPHGAEANGGGTRVNNYTVITDLFFTNDDWSNPPAGHDPGWTPIYQTNPANAEDAMLWVRITDGALGDDGYYGGTLGWVQPERWMRLVAVVEYDPDFVDPNNPGDDVFVTKYVIYDDDTRVGPVHHATGAGDDFLDGKRALRTNEEAGFDALLFFTNNWWSPVYTHSGYVSSIQVRDYAMPPAEVAALPGPRAAGIPCDPVCPECPEDINGDGVVSLPDLAILLANFGRTDAGPEDGDINGDGSVNLADLALFLSAYGTTCS